MNLDAYVANYRKWLAEDGGRFSPDPFEMMDAAWECKHGNVPAHGCPEGCFRGEVREHEEALPQVARHPEGLGGIRRGVQDQHRAAHGGVRTDQAVLTRG